MPRKPLALAAALVAVALLAPSAHAAPAKAGTFDVSGQPLEITVGTDGTVWFVISGSSAGKEFGRVTTAGVEEEFDSPNDATLKGIVTGPDGNIWATAINNVIKIPPSNPAGAAGFQDNNIGQPSDITVGPDGHLWTGSQNNVIEIPPDNPGAGIGQGDENHTGIVTGNDPRGITTGGDGNLWIVDNHGDEHSSIVRFNTAGTIIGTPTETGGPLFQSQIIAGPSGQLAFTQPGSTPQRIGRINFSGHIDFTNTPDGIGDPTGIVFGNDGAYWTANFGVDKLRRMTPDGTITEPITFDTLDGPRYLAKGPNDTLWVSLDGGHKIAKITGVSAPPGGGNNPPPPPKDTTAPAVSSLKLSDTSFLVGSQLASFSRKRTPVGTTISFKLSEISATKFTFSYQAKGFKSGTRCVAHKPRGKKKAKRCTRVAGTITHKNTAAGSRKLEFEGRFSKRKALKPGRYKLSLTATDAAGNKSKPRTASFRVLKK